MRQMTRHATHYVSQRKAFGMTLSDAPAMQAVLAELSVESEAAVAASLLLARSFDDCASEEAARRGGYPSLRLATAFRRLAVAAGKYYICKRAPAVAYEALGASRSPVTVTARPNPAPRRLHLLHSLLSPLHSLRVRLRACREHRWQRFR